MAFLTGTDTAWLQGLDGYYLTDGLDEDNLSTLDVNSAIISQYANSPIIRQLIDTFNLALATGANINAFYQQVWDIDTAQGYGLDVWGRIVGVTRAVTVPPDGDAGFSEGQYQPLGQGPFYSGALVGADYILDDQEFRTLILLKAAANISRVTAPVVNKLLSTLFDGRGTCYVLDPGKMRMVLTFEFPLQPYEYAIVTQTGVIPRPAGVQLFIQQVDPDGRAGFTEGQWQPFGQGNFAGDAGNAVQ